MYLLVVHFHALVFSSVWLTLHFLSLHPEASFQGRQTSQLIVHLRETETLFNLIPLPHTHPAYPLFSPSSLSFSALSFLFSLPSSSTVVSAVFNFSFDSCSWSSALSRSSSISFSFLVWLASSLSAYMYIHTVECNNYFVFYSETYCDYLLAPKFDYAKLCLKVVQCSSTVPNCLCGLIQRWLP